MFWGPIDELVSTTNLTFPRIKLMVPLGLPSRQRTTNIQVIKQSNELVKKYKIKNQPFCAITADCSLKETR